MPPAVELAAAAPPGATALVVTASAGPDTAVLDPRAGAHLRAAAIAEEALGAVAASITRDKVKGNPGDLVVVPVGDRLLIAVGVGGGSARDFRRAGAAVARRVKSVERAAVALPAGVGAGPLRALAEGLLLGGYSFKVTNNPKRQPLTSVTIVARGGASSEAALRAGVTTAIATMLARDLAFTPSSVKTPQWLAQQARTVARASGLEIVVRDERQLAAEGFGGVVAVGMGSAHPPRLIELTYTPDDPLPGHVVLVGKGITFDSGGLSLKPTAGMVAMKTDMAAGGAVIATMSALRELGVRVKVTGLVPAAENMPSGSAQRPSDVITQYGGATVEVLNTDAEGRLVLADALAYADANLDPDVVVDLATLTGAISSGLGKRHAGLFTDDDRLRAALLAAGEASGEGVWPMPFVEDYRDALDSTVADLANVAIGGRDYKGGAIVAALFLREFAGDRRWAHLDIAGVGRAEADEHEVIKGPTGYGVRLLLHWLAGND
ncbi:MAG TPA: leucyl aminopeptidase, partial [Acidothermaceae bacterium]|nr:leucyl aminopeptidase [Acidothermaceae bacterium]